MLEIKTGKNNLSTTLVLLLAGLVALSPLAIDTYIAAMPDMASFFGVSIGTIELTMTLYFLGFSVGNFLGGPLSDSFGRKTIALTGIALYGLSALAISFTDVVEVVLVLRVLQSFGGGFATVTSAVIVRDWFEGKEVAKMLTIIGMIIMLAPLFAPVIGGFLIAMAGWQSVFIFMFVFAIVIFTSFFFLLPESRKPELITNKITPIQIYGKYKAFFSDKRSVLMLLAISFPMSGLYVFLTKASSIYISYYGIEQNIFPLYFGANIILNIMLSLANTRLLKKYKPETILKSGLLLQLFGGILFMGFTLFGNPPLEAVFVSIIIYIGSLGLIFGNGSAVILNYNPEVAGSANATIGISRFLLSFFIGSILTLFDNSTLLPVATILFICSLLGNILVYLFKVIFKE